MRDHSRSRRSDEENQQQEQTEPGRGEQQEEWIEQVELFLDRETQKWPVTPGVRWGSRNIRTLWRLEEVPPRIRQSPGEE